MACINPAEARFIGMNLDRADVLPLMAAALKQISPRGTFPGFEKRDWPLLTQNIGRHYDPSVVVELRDNMPHAEESEARASDPGLQYEP